MISLSDYLKSLSLHNRRLFLLLIGTLLFSAGFIMLVISDKTSHEVSSVTELREAEEYLKQNSKESAKEAVRIFNRILASGPKSNIRQRAKYGTAVALERLQENAAALQYYRELNSENIQNKRLRDKVNYAIGRFYLYLNYEKEGSSILNALLRETQDNKLKSKAYTAYGMYYLRKKDCKRAEENFRIAINYDQENLQAKEGQAKALKGQGQDWIAYRHYDNYLVGISNLNPKKRKEVVNEVEQEMFESGIKAFRKGNYQSAISFFKKLCVSTKDKYIEENARFWIGESYAALGLNEKAMKLYSSVLNNGITQKDAISLFRKGELLFNQNKIKAAGKIFEKIYNDYPHSEYSLKAKKHLDDIHEELKEQDLIKQNIYEKPKPLSSESNNGPEAISPSIIN